MIHNFRELMVLIGCCDTQIDSIKEEMEFAERKYNFGKLAQLETEKNVLQKKIHNYILSYKSKIQNNQLESRIFGSKLEVLEKHYNLINKRYGSDTLLS